MALLADRRDYKRGYYRNITAYRELTEKNLYSRRMLLFYSIECGLKSLLLDKWGIVDMRQIEKDSDREKLLHSHNLRGILKELGYQGLLKLPTLKTIHNDPVDATSYHQAWRYGVPIVAGDVEKEKCLEQDLIEIANWLFERVVK